MLNDNIDRPLRYTPEGGDFVIVNGREFFNRSLYGGSSPFRVDGGDLPEFSFYLPGRGGNLRLAYSTPDGIKWMHESAKVVARYHAGMMTYQLEDPLLGKGALTLVAVVPRDGEGLILELESPAGLLPLTIHVAFAGMDGVRGGRDGDIGCERVPVREFFQYNPDAAKDNKVHSDAGGFVNQSALGSMIGLLPEAAQTRPLSNAIWRDAKMLQSAKESEDPSRIATGSFQLSPGSRTHVALQFIAAKELGGRESNEILNETQQSGDVTPAAAKPGSASLWSRSGISKRFEMERKEQEAIAGRVSIQTPDEFINAALPALAIAADGVWDDRIGAYLHGGVAWRTPLLGWRVSYAGDVFGWHDRTRSHFDRYASKQNTQPIADRIPPPEQEAYLARNETALHSNGDMTSSHYDMNMVGVDTIFRHLLWTGDLEYARQIWPVIERHLAWERRMFRREFGPEKLPLYEAYACIWASDSLAYNGGGGSHSTAYNLYHNRMAARIAKLIGKDPTPYETEAALIQKGMEQLLWLKDKGWFAEWKDLLGDQKAHEEAAAWTFYHTVDSEVPDPQKAWQMSRFVETRLPHIPIRGAGVPSGNYTVSTTSWMPWVWSLNNVVMGESAHTAHALWQSGKSDSAFQLFKGAILDSMYLGICPGNVGMCTWYDPNRRESQRDFGDGVGALSRAFMEGLFGITPDLLAGELKIRPGFPADWDKAAIQHPSFDMSYERKNDTERFKVVSRFKKHVAVRMELAALRDGPVSVTSNGEELEWKLVHESVGKPRLEILSPAAAEHEIIIRWNGDTPAAVPQEIAAKPGERFSADAGGSIQEIADPQGALSNARHEGKLLTGIVSGTTGHRTLFARVSQGKLAWWQPISLRIEEAAPAKSIVFNTDWKKPLSSSVKLDTVPLENIFNEQADGIFKQDYISPRSPHVSLSLPRHGYGSWCHPKNSYHIDDSGIRKTAGPANRIVLPNGIPLATPGDAEAKNIAFVSRWDNFPQEISVPLSGKASKIHLLMAGSTDGMKSRRDNGEVIITYNDGSTTRLALENPTTWWPIDQDYFIDDFAFRRPGPLPVRVDLMTGKIRVLDEKTFAGKGRRVAGGAATVLDIDLDPSKEMKSLKVRAIANEVVIGLMSATLQRP